MSRIFDSFIFGSNLDMLECRLTELSASRVYRHVLVESSRDHQGHPKPLYFAEHKSRFAPWMDRIIHVITPLLPTAPDPWVREHAQREYTSWGLRQAESDDVVLHGDVDEIPRAGGVTADAAGHVLAGPQYIFAVDWLDPRGEWPGMVAMRAEDIKSFAWMRGQRDFIPRLDNAAWHLTWLGGPDAIEAKLSTFCHLETADLIRAGNQAHRLYEGGRFWADGPQERWFDLGLQLSPVDVDGTWPQWVAEKRCPPAWFRPR